MGEFVLAENELAEDEEATGLAFNGHAPLHRGLVAGGERRDQNCPLPQPIDPAAIVETDLEGGRHSQQPPAVLHLYEHPQPAAAGDVVGIARDGKELVEGRVADSELRAEDAVHPACRAEEIVAGSIDVAAAQQGAMAARAT